MASDQISRVCLCCSLPLSLAASSPSAVSQENNGNSQRESSGGRAGRPSVWQARQIQRQHRERGERERETAAKRCQVTPPFAPSPRGRRCPQAKRSRRMCVIFLPTARALAPSFTNGLCLQPFKCSVIVNIQAWLGLENWIFPLDQQSEGTPVLNTNVIARRILWK